VSVACGCVDVTFCVADAETGVILASLSFAILRGPAITSGDRVHTVVVVGGGRLQEGCHWLLC